MTGNFINDVAVYDVPALSAQSDFEREFPEVLRPYQYSDNNKQMYPNFNNGDSYERSGYIQSGEMNWYFYFPNPAKDENDKITDPLYKRIISGENSKGQTLTAPFILRSELKEYKIYAATNPGGYSLSHDFTDYDIYLFDGNSGASISTVYFFIYNFVKKKVYAVFKTDPKVNLHFLFKPRQATAYNPTNVSVALYTNTSYIKSITYPNVPVDTSETMLTLNGNVIPNIMIEKYTDDNNADAKIDKQIGYFKQIWENRDSSLQPAAGRKTKTITIYFYPNSVSADPTLLVSFENKKQKVPFTEYFSNSSIVTSNKFTNSYSYLNSYTSAKEIFGQFTGEVIKSILTSDSAEDKFKLAQAILNQNMIEQDAKYLTASGLSVQIFDSSANLIAPDKVEDSSETTYIVKVSYYLKDIEKTGNINSIDDSNLQKYQSVPGSDATSIDLSVDDYFIQDTTNTNVYLDSILFFKNAQGTLIGDDAPISSDFSTESTYLTDIKITENKVELIDTFKTQLQTFYNNSVEPNLVDNKNQALYDLYNAYVESGYVDFNKKFVKSFETDISYSDAISQCVGTETIDSADDPYEFSFDAISEKLFIRMKLPEGYSSDTIYIKVEVKTKNNDLIDITKGIDTATEESVTFPWCFKNENDPGYLYLSTSFIKDYPEDDSISGLKISLVDSSGAMVENWSE